jgi:hypothetical protein
VVGVKTMPATVREFEEHLRDVGFSAHDAKNIASRGFKAADEARDEREALAAVAALIRNSTILKG